MTDSRRGKKTNHIRNHKSREDWIAGKKIGRVKQVWVWDVLNEYVNRGHWEKRRNNGN